MAFEGLVTGPDGSDSGSMLAFARRYPHELGASLLTVSGLMAAVAAMMTNSTALADQGVGPAALPPPPQPPALIVRNLSPQDALSINAAIPISGDNSKPARMFKVKRETESYDRALECLTQAVYYEAGNESSEGQEAVAQVVLNRVRHPAFPSTVCGVIYQGSERSTGCQFTFTCDGALSRKPSADRWARSRKVAEAALAGTVFKPVGLATHYHANYVVPYWATSLAKNAVIGAHIFYLWSGQWGTPAAYRQRYAGVEPDVSVLKNAALAAHQPEFTPDGTPALSFSADSRLELVGVLQLLGGGAGVGQGAYAHDAAAYFQAYADHPAVKLYRDWIAARGPGGPVLAAELALHHSPPPALNQTQSLPGGLVAAAGGTAAAADLMGALRDFAAASDFAAFFKAHGDHYAGVASRVRQQVENAELKVERYAGMPLAQRRVLVAAALADPPGNLCGIEGGGAATVLVGASTAEGGGSLSREQVARLLVPAMADALAKPADAGKSAGAPDDRLARAAVSRALGLEAGDGCGQSAEMSARLQAFERERGRYRSLRDFLPRLTGTRSAAADPTPVSGRPKAL